MQKIVEVVTVDNLWITSGVIHRLESAHSVALVVINKLSTSTLLSHQIMVRVKNH